MTNAERIRQMTDEELISFFARDYCPPAQSIGPSCTGKEVCFQCWRTWLKSDNPDESDAVDRSDECKE